MMKNTCFPINVPFAAIPRQNRVGAVAGENQAAPAVTGFSSACNITKKSLLFLFIFVAVSFSAESCAQNVTGTILSEQGSNIAIAMMLIVLLISIAYMIGRFTGEVKFTVFAKDELYHLFISVLLLIGFTGIMGFACQTMDFFYTSTFEKLGPLKCYESGDELTSVAKCYISSAKSDAEQIAQHYLKEYIDNQMSATFSVTIQIPLLDAYTVSADAYKKVYSQQYDMVLNSFVIPALLSLNMQKILLEFISDNVIKWVLPIAFLFRVFFPTRQMGNFLIALAVGLYIIIPLMYTLNLAMYDIVSLDCSAFQSATNDYIFGSGCGAYGFWNVGRLIPQAFFLPNLTIALFITFMASVNKALRVIG